MKMDWFVAGLGTAEAEISDEHRALMLVKAEEFLKVGRLSRQEWESLNEESQSIFLDAADRISSAEVKAISEGVRMMVDLNGLE